MIPRSVKILIAVHIVITLVGLLAHMKLHPVTKSLFFWWATPVSVFSLLVIPVLYARPATAAWGFLFNTMSVAIGTIAMLYFSLLTFGAPFTLYRLAMESTILKVFFLWTKLPVGYFILIKMKPLKSVRLREGCLE